MNPSVKWAYSFTCKSSVRVWFRCGSPPDSDLRLKFSRQHHMLPLLFSLLLASGETPHWTLDQHLGTGFSTIANRLANIKIKPMSGSFKKTPIIALGWARSEKKDKVAHHRKLRRGIASLLRTEPEREILLTARELDSTRRWGKDPRCWNLGLCHREPKLLRK